MQWLNKVNQEILLKLLSRQDNKAYRYLYQRFYIGLKAVANYYTRDDLSADDLVQDVFISMLDGQQHFNTMNDIKYFLYTALKNKCLNYLRNQKVREKYVQQNFLPQNEIDTYWDKVLKEDVYSTLYAAIQSLSPQCRQVMLFSLEGMKLSEIAEKMNLTLDTIKEYRGNGKKKLLSLLEGKDITLLVSWFWL